MNGWLRRENRKDTCCPCGDALGTTVICKLVSEFAIRRPLFLFVLFLWPAYLPGQRAVVALANHSGIDLDVAVFIYA